jgi:hypothetical protein
MRGFSKNSEPLSAAYSSILILAFDEVGFCSPMPG